VDFSVILEDVLLESWYEKAFVVVTEKVCVIVALLGPFLLSCIIVSKIFGVGNGEYNGKDEGSRLPRSGRVVFISCEV